MRDPGNEVALRVRAILKSKILLRPISLTSYKSPCLLSINPRFSSQDYEIGKRVCIENFHYECFTSPRHPECSMLLF